MNIWYFHHYATPTSIAGLHRPYEFGKFFLSAGNRITVFTSSYLHFEGKNQITNKKEFVIKQFDGIPTVIVKTCGYHNSGFNRIRNMFQFYFHLIRVAKLYVKRNGKPDIIIASSPHPLTMIAGIQLSRKYCIPNISEIRDFWPEVFFTAGRLKEHSIIGKILLYGERWIYKNSESLLFLKEGDPEYLKEHKWDIASGGDIDNSKCYYVNNGVDIDQFDKRKENNVLVDEDLDSDLFKVVYCGTIRHVNHLDLLVDAGKILSNNIVILIYGTGDCVEELIARTKIEKINNVKFKGYVDNKYIPYILNKSSINVLNYSASTYNWSRGNSSNKLFEYFASGKPILSTIKMGYDLIEKYSCGISIDKCNSIYVAKAIQQFVNLSSQEYAQYCMNARKAAEEFDIPVLAEKYLKIIEKVRNNYTEGRV